MSKATHLAGGRIESRRPGPGAALSPLCPGGQFAILVRDGDGGRVQNTEPKVRGSSFPRSLSHCGI